MCLRQGRQCTNIMPMNKRQAKNLFGGRDQDLARAVGVTRSAVSQWKDELTQEQIDRVMGAALRLGKLDCQSMAQKIDLEAA